MSRITRGRRRLYGAVAVLLALGALAGGIAAATTGGSTGTPATTPAPAERAGVSTGKATAEDESSTDEGGVPDTDEFINETLIVPREGWQTDFSKHTVPLLEFVRGGPGKDGIPAIDEPRFESIEEAGSWLDAREPVLVLELNGIVRAYPMLILVWHEIVNDSLGDAPVVVTFCPLCNTAIAFERVVDGQVLDFGTTGNLRNNDLVMYDRQTETWWQQFGGDAVVGELSGTKLAQLPASVVAFEDFAREHPAAEVLSRDTGHERPYGGRPYAGYDDLGSPTIFGSDNQSDDRVPLKERVVFVERGDEAIAVPFSALEEAATIEVEVGGDELVVTWLPDVRSPFGSAEHEDGKLVGSAEVRLASTREIVPFDLPFWFAVAAFRPDVEVVRS